MKNLRAIALILVIGMSSSGIFAQDSYDVDEPASVANFGLGLGIDYGGIGARLSFLPIKHIALFGALGYNLDGLGYQGGVAFQLLPDKRVCPTLMGMYGYNAVIVVKGADQYNKTYNGPSIGAGVQIKSRSGQNFFNVELLLPFRPKEFDDDLSALQNNSQITGLTKPPPVSISLGYHIILGNRGY